MNFPIWLNKWIIRLKPIQHTTVWYWYRLINHSDFRLDDRYRYIDFWEELSIGWYEMRDEWIMKQPNFDPYNLSGRDLYYTYILSKK